MGGGDKHNEASLLSQVILVFHFPEAGLSVNVDLIK